MGKLLNGLLLFHRELLLNLLFHKLLVLPQLLLFQLLLPKGDPKPLPQSGAGALLARGAIGGLGGELNENVELPKLGVDGQEVDPNWLLGVGGVNVNGCELKTLLVLLNGFPNGFELEDPKVPVLLPNGEEPDPKVLLPNGEDPKALLLPNDPLPKVLFEPNPNG